VNPDSNPSILVVEDDAGNAMLLKAVLTTAGYTVATVQNGSEAVDTVRVNDFDLIFMDVNLPDLSGIEATKLIKLLPSPAKDIPVVAITALGEIVRKECADVGMEGFLTKPVSPAVLLETVLLHSPPKQVQALG